MVLVHKHRRLATILVGLTLLGSSSAQDELQVRKQPPGVTAENPLRTHYQISLELDFDNRSYTGAERLRWFNQADRSASVLYFHLYSNLRVDSSSSSGGLEPDEPRLEITRVRSADTEMPLSFSLDDQGTTLRVNLREPLPPGEATEIEVRFRGSVPEIDADETGLTTHVVKQISAALRSEREIRRPRDINFRSRGVMLLSTFYPVLAVHDGEEWHRKLEPSIGDFVFNEIADYEVSIEVSPGVSIFTSGFERSKTGGVKEVTTFSGSGLRDFTIVAGRNLRTEEVDVGGKKIRSIFVPEHERIGKRVLRISADAARIFNSRFGPLPFDSVTIVEAPLVAGLGSTEFSAFNLIASAFYVDFDSPAMRNLPEIIREQRAAVEQSLEWTVAHLMAHQWWGVAVGSDPAREPVLDEALASWSALLYYREVYGDEQATAVLRDELTGVYRLYRTFGGEDMTANRPSREYRNSFQYEAIVTTKGALMFIELRRMLGDERFFRALQNYYKSNMFEIAELQNLRAAFIAETPVEQRQAVTRTFTRWLATKHGDEDVARPDAELANTLGLPAKPGQQKSGDRGALTAFAKVGKFFWQQMTRIR
jgi:Peptidase family M1 domain